MTSGDAPQGIRLAADESRHTAAALHARAVEASRAGRQKEAASLYRRCLELARRLGLQDVEAECLANFGTLQCLRGCVREGVGLLQRARLLRARQGDSVGEARVLIQLGPAYRSLGANAEAVSVLHEGIERLEGKGHDLFVAGGLSTLSYIYASVGLHDEAIRCAAEGLARVGDQGDAAVRQVLLGALADAHRGAGAFDEARAAAEAMLAEARRAGSEAELVDALETLGHVHWDAGRVEEAETLLREAWDSARRLGPVPQKLAIARGLIRILLSRDEVAAAERLLSPLVPAWERSGEPGSREALHELQATLAERRGDFQAAVTHLRRLEELRRAVFARETDVRLRHGEVARELRREQRRTAEVLRQVSQRITASQEEERRRLALELHDDFGQRLALLAIELDLIAQDPPEGAELRDRASRLSDGVREIADAVHATSHRLHPRVLDELGLTEAVRSLCCEMAAAYPCVVTFDASAIPEELAPDAALCLYRVAQETIRNAIRHGKASGVRVRLGCARDGLTLSVVDDGVGFEPEAQRNTGLGLIGMEERVRHLGGTLGVQSRPGEGARVEAYLPLGRVEGRA